MWTTVSSFKLQRRERAPPPKKNTQHERCTVIHRFRLFGWTLGHLLEITEKVMQSTSLITKSWRFYEEMVLAYRRPFFHYGSVHCGGPALYDAGVWKPSKTLCSSTLLRWKGYPQSEQHPLQARGCEADWLLTDGLQWIVVCVDGDVASKSVDM